jgi:hypothetical protein
MRVAVDEGRAVLNPRPEVRASRSREIRVPQFAPPPVSVIITPPENRFVGICFSASEEK